MILVRERYDPLIGDDIRFLEPSEWAGRKVLDLVPERVRESKVTLQAVRNGVDLTDEMLRETLVEDGDKIILRVVPGVELTLSGVLLWLLGTLAAAGIGIGISYLIQAIMGEPRKPRGDKSSAAYDFDTPQNTTANGTPIMVVYGQMRVAGHILQAKTRSSAFGGEKALLTMDLLIGLGEGGEVGYKKICGKTVDTDEDASPPPSLEINGNPASTYRDITLSVRMGTKNQGIIPTFEDTVLKVIALDSVMLYSVPITVTTDNEVDVVTIKVKFPFGAFLIGKKGQVLPITVPGLTLNPNRSNLWFTFKWRPLGETAWRDEKLITIIGARREPFYVSRRTSGMHKTKVQVQVERLTLDPPYGTEDFPATNQFSEMRLVEVTEIIDDDSAYVGKALGAVTAVATEQLHGTQPNVTFLVDGLQVRVYTTSTSYTYQWTRNPSWVILDLIANKRYGLGDQVSYEDCQIQDFIDFAAYCDATVPDGKGGSEKRCEVDVVIDERREAWEWIHEIAMTCQAILFISGGSYRIKADTIGSPVMLFTPGNMRDFSVGYTPPKDRVNYVEVTYFDRNLNFRREIVVEVDPDVQDVDDYMKDSIELVGVTRRSQAHRIATYRINSNKLLTHYFQWSADVAAVRCEPGDVVEVATESVGWGIATGLVVAAGSATLTLDKAVTLEVGKLYSVRVWHSDGSFETRSVAASAGTYETIVVSNSWTQIPAQYRPYSLGEVATFTRQVKIVEVTIQADMTVSISGVEYNPLIYSDSIITLPPDPTNLGFDPNEIPPDVEDLKVTQRIEILPDGTMDISIDVNFNIPTSPIYTGASVWLRFAAIPDIGTEWPSTPVLAHVRGNYASIRGNLATGDVVVIAVTSENPLGLSKQPEDAPSSLLTIGASADLPDDVTGFSIVRNGDLLRFSWDAVTSPSILGYEIRQSGAAADWEGGVVIGMDLVGTSYETNAFYAQKTSYTATFLVKAKNRFGNYSLNAAVVAIILDPRVDHNVVESRNYRDLDWPLGDRTNLELGAGGVGDRNLEVIDRGPIVYRRGHYTAASRDDGPGGAYTLGVLTHQSALSATVNSGGTGYTLDDILTVSGGVFTVAAQFKATGVSGGVVTSVTRETQGVYTTPPANPAATTGGTGTGATLDAAYAHQPAGTIKRKRTRRWVWRRQRLEVVTFHRPLESFYTSPEIDLGVSLRSITAGLVQASQVDPGVTWADATFSWDSQTAQERTWAGLLGVKHLTAIPEWRHGESSPLAGVFKALTPTDITYRYAQFRARLVLDDPNFDGSLEEFNVTIDVPDTIDHGTGTTDGSGILDVTYAKTFYKLSSIAKEVTVKNGATGDYITISLETLTGFRVTAKDSANNPISGRNVEWIAKGY